MEKKKAQKQKTMSDGTPEEETKKKATTTTTEKGEEEEEEERKKEEKEEKEEKDGVWEDVTAALYEAAEALPHVVGAPTYVATRDFSVERAMYGVDMCDARMDAGVGYAAVRLFDEAALPVAPPALTRAAAVGVLDAVLGAAAAWLRGDAHPLHTLYSCAYLQCAPARIAAPWLRAPLRAATWAVLAAQALCRTAGVAAAEDIVTTSYGLLAAHTVAPTAAYCDTTVLPDLETAATSAMAASAADDEEDKEVSEALRTRIELCTALVRVLRAAEDRDVAALDAHATCARALVAERVVATAACGVLPEGACDPQMWRRCRRAPSIKHVVLPALPDAVAVLAGVLDDVADAAALLRSAGPSADYFALLFAVDRYMDARRRSPVARSILAHILCSGKDNSGQSKDKGSEDKGSEDAVPASPRVLLANTLAVYPVAPAVCAHERAQGALDALAQAWTDTLHFALRSVARQQRHVDQVLRRWEDVQGATSAADDALAQKMPAPPAQEQQQQQQQQQQHERHERHERGHQARDMRARLQQQVRARTKDPRDVRLEHQLTMTCVFAKCVLMWRHLCHGFALRLYGAGEWLVVLWYMDYLLSSAAQQLAERAAGIGAYAARYRAAPSALARARRAPRITPGTAETRRAALGALLALHSHLVRGAVRHQSVLRRVGLLVPPACPYGSDEARFERRFEPFLAVSVPAALYHSQYRENTACTRFEPAALLGAAVDAYTAARTALLALARADEAPGASVSCRADAPLVPPAAARTLLRLVVTDLVALEQLRAALPVAPAYVATHTATCDFSLSPMYPTIAVHEKQAKEQAKTTKAN